jgi:hypothetical protein
VAAVLLCSCALQDDVYTLDHRLSALERRNLELEKQNKELEKLNQDMLQAKENISSRVEGLDQTRRNDEVDCEDNMPGWLPSCKASRNRLRCFPAVSKRWSICFNQKLNGFEENQTKNLERMDRLATDMAALQKRSI